MTLLLGPPGSGRSTLLQALAGKLDRNLKVRTFYLWYIFELFYEINLVLSILYLIIEWSKLKNIKIK